MCVVLLVSSCVCACLPAAELMWACVRACMRLCVRADVCACEGMGRVEGEDATAATEIERRKGLRREGLGNRFMKLRLDRVLRLDLGAMTPEEALQATAQVCALLSSPCLASLHEAPPQRTGRSPDALPPGMRIAGCLLTQPALPVVACSSHTTHIPGTLRWPVLVAHCAGPSHTAVGRGTQQ